MQAFTKSLQQDHTFILLVPQTALMILLPRRLVKHRWIQTPLPALCLSQAGIPRFSPARGPDPEKLETSSKSSAGTFNRRQQTTQTWLSSLWWRMFPSGQIWGLFWEWRRNAEDREKGREECCIVDSPFLAALWVKNGLLSPGLLISSKCPQRKQTTAK